MSTQDNKDKMTYVPHRVSKKQEFVMNATTKIQKNKRDYGDILLALRGITREDRFWNLGQRPPVVGKSMHGESNE